MNIRLTLIVLNTQGMHRFILTCLASYDQVTAMSLDTYMIAVFIPVLFRSLENLKPNSCNPRFEWPHFKARPYSPRMNNR